MIDNIGSFCMCVYNSFYINTTIIIINISLIGKANSRKSYKTGKFSFFNPRKNYQKDKKLKVK